VAMSTQKGAGLAKGEFFRPRRLGHVNLVIDDVDQSVAFYRDVAGLNIAYLRPQVQAAFMTNGNTHHDIGMVSRQGPLGKGRSAGLNHIAFELETEVDLVSGYERAAQSGVQFLRTADHDIAHALYFADPDGNQCEIYADVVKEWWKVRSGVVNKPKPNWTPGSTPPNPDRNYHVAPELIPVEGATFGSRRITHAALVVNRFEDCAEFYSSVVGLNFLIGSPDAPFAVLGGTLGEFNLSLFRAGGGLVPGLHHLGLAVGGIDEFEKAVASLRSQGLTPELLVEAVERRSVFLRDPNGVLIQFHTGEPPASMLEECRPEAALFVI